jgi:hypothetical protein
VVSLCKKLLSWSRGLSLDRGRAGIGVRPSFLSPFSGTTKRSCSWTAAPRVWAITLSTKWYTIGFGELRPFKSVVPPFVSAAGS